MSVHVIRNVYEAHNEKYNKPYIKSDIQYSSDQEIICMSFGFLLWFILQGLSYIFHNSSTTLVLFEGFNLWNTFKSLAIGPQMVCIKDYTRKNGQKIYSETSKYIKCEYVRLALRVVGIAGLLAEYSCFSMKVFPN